MRRGEKEGNEKKEKKARREECERRKEDDVEDEEEGGDRSGTCGLGTAGITVTTSHDMDEPHE